MTRAAVYLPDGCEGPGLRPGPGRLAEADIGVERWGGSEVVLPEATIRDERGGRLLADGPLIFRPAAGGGPLAGADQERQARAFGLVNTAYHLQRALRYLEALLGHPLPRPVARIGMHDQPRRWGGGHYRLPGPSLPAENTPVRPDGEIHLGGGAAFLPSARHGRYFHAPAHNTAIIYHEIGHHLCRHTADFRLNGLRPPDAQTNKKVALDEGTADVVAAVLLGTPDIYGWHRHALHPADQRRRRLDGGWTMAHFRGGPGQDPHADGTVWASACWSARRRVIAAGLGPVRFDSMLVRGLLIFGRDRPQAVSEEAVRGRRHFSRLLGAMAQADARLAPLVLAAMAEHGIRPGVSNAELARAARSGTTGGAAP